MTSQAGAGSRDVLVVEEVNGWEQAEGYEYAQNPACSAVGEPEEAVVEKREATSSRTQRVESQQGRTEPSSYIQTTHIMGKGGNDTTSYKLGATVTLIDEKRDSALGTEQTTDTAQTKTTGSGLPDPNNTHVTVTPGKKAGCVERNKDEYDRDEETMKKRHIVEKLVFVTSVVSLMTLTVSIVMSHWLLPYYYAVFAPILIFIRFIMYWKFKWQLFLIDFCYFGNLLCYIFIWAAPNNPYVFFVLFAICNGPLAWAIPLFRNSVVFHSTDKMTSTFIHTLPLFITYCIRWFPSSTSLYWYRPFLSTFSEDVGTLFIYMVAVPYGCYMVHSLVSILVIFVIVRPSDKYLHTYSYLTEYTSFSKIFTCLGPKFKPLIFYGTNWLFTLLAMMFSILFYKYFIAHTICLAVFMLIALWNGSSFYMDKFAYTGHRADS